MNNNIRIGLLAASAIAALSLAACKTTDDMSQDTAPQAAPTAPADTGMPPADTTMPTNTSTSATPATTP
jgi:hypothetical protein